MTEKLVPRYGAEGNLGCYLGWGGVSGQCSTWNIAQTLRNISQQGLDTAPARIIAMFASIASSLGTAAPAMAVFLSPPILEVPWRQPTKDDTQAEIVQAQAIAEGLMRDLAFPGGPISRTPWSINLSPGGAHHESQTVYLNPTRMPTTAMRHYHDSAVAAQKLPTARQDPLLRSCLRLTALTAKRLLDQMSGYRTEGGMMRLVTLYRAPSPQGTVQGTTRDEIEWDLVYGGELVPALMAFCGLYLLGIVEIDTLIPVGQPPSDPPIMRHRPQGVGIGVAGALRIYAWPLMIGTMDGSAGFVQVDRNLVIGPTDPPSTPTSRATGIVRLEIADKTTYFAGDSWD